MTHVKAGVNVLPDPADLGRGIRNLRVGWGHGHQVQARNRSVREDPIDDRLVRSILPLERVVAGRLAEPLEGGPCLGHLCAIGLGDEVQETATEQCPRGLLKDRGGRIVDRQDPAILVVEDDPERHAAPFALVHPTRPG
jgi:hypothetical protein